MTTEWALREILAELTRAETKFPGWPEDALHALAVLGEEFGELTQAVLQRTYEAEESDVIAWAVRTEAVQTAAMALRFLINIEGYLYRPCVQMYRTEDPEELRPSVQAYRADDADAEDPDELRNP